MDTEAPQASDLPFTLSPRAIEMGKKKLEEAEGEVLGIRVGVKGGGCSGLSYVFDFARRVREGKDRILDFDGLQIVVDHRSLKYLAGAVLDWNDALVGHGFKWKNPNARSDCGCGGSFAV